MRGEYVSTEFNCRRISAIVHRSASDKLAVDSLVLLVFGFSLIPQRERNSVWQIVSDQTFVNDKLVSGNLSKCLYIHSRTRTFYLHLNSSSTELVTTYNT